MAAAVAPPVPATPTEEWKRAFDVCKGKMERRFQHLFDCIVLEVAQAYLGQVSHICTNDYYRADGVSLWTDHGIDHSKRVLWEAMKLAAGLLPQKPTPYEWFLIGAASALHDVGMFVRLIEGDVERQREFHGRLAMTVLGNAVERLASLHAEPTRADVVYIGLLAQLHQTDEFKSFLKHTDETGSGPRDYLAEHKKPSKPRHPLTADRIAQLGSTILMADALDVHPARSKDKVMYDTFAQVIGHVNLRSHTEWLVNSLVRDRTISVSGRNLEAVYEVDPKEVIDVLQLSKRGVEHDASKEDGGDNDAAMYFLCLLWRYLYDKHFSVIRDTFGVRGRRGVTNRPLLTVSVKCGGEILVADDPNRHQAPTSTRVSTAETRTIYDDEWRFWYEGLQYLTLGRPVQRAIAAANEVLGMDACFLLVKDRIRKVIRIIIPRDFEDIYRDYFWRFEHPTMDRRQRDVNWARLSESVRATKIAGYRDLLRSVRVPEKTSVIGQVWFRGLPEQVSLVGGPGRMMREEMDTALGLQELLYCPAIMRGKAKGGKVSRTLKFVMVFNRKWERPEREDVDQAIHEYCRKAWRAYTDGRAPVPLPAVVRTQVNALAACLSERLSLAQPVT